jgi:hypothetical protein
MTILAGFSPIAAAGFEPSGGKRSSAKATRSRRDPREVPVLQDRRRGGRACVGGTGQYRRTRAPSRRAKAAVSGRAAPCTRVLYPSRRPLGCGVGRRPRTTRVRLDKQPNRCGDPGRRSLAARSRDNGVGAWSPPASLPRLDGAAPPFRRSDRVSDVPAPARYEVFPAPSR